MMSLKEPLNAEMESKKTQKRKRGNHLSVFHLWWWWWWWCQFTLSLEQLHKSCKVVSLPELKRFTSLHVRSAWTPSPVFTHHPPSLPLLHPPLPPSPSSVLWWSPGEEGRELEGSQGQSLFLFGSWASLWKSWRERGCIRARVGGGQDFNSVKEQLVWVFPHHHPFSPTSHQPTPLSANPGRWKICSEGNQ